MGAKRSKKENKTALVPVKRNEPSLFSPFHGIDTLQEHMNRFFDFSLARFFDDFGRSNLLRTSFGPPIDIYESGNEIHIKADLPGISKDEIDISVKGDRLFIKGEKKLEKEEKKKGHVRAERFYGSFQRIINLPTEVNEDKVKALYKDGVLEITLPKKEGTRPKQVKVEVD